MKLRHVSVLIIAVLCLAVTGGSASGDERAENSAATDDDGSQPARDTWEQLERDYPGFRRPSGKSAEERRSELSRPLTPAEVEANRQRDLRNASTPHYYPEAPDDPRTDPPTLDDDGEEVR